MMGITGVMRMTVCVHRASMMVDALLGNPKFQQTGGMKVK